VTPTALTIGNFDGVHLGHRALIERCRQHVGPSGRVVALAFDPHPNAIINPAKPHALLTTLNPRRDLLLASGADEVLRLEPTPELLSLPPHDFIHSLVSTYSPTWFVEGDDFHFGKARAGNVHTLTLLGSFLNFNVDVVEPQTLHLLDHFVVKASSTLVRWLLANGRAADAALVLGRPYTLEGTVTQGDRRGRTIGFPTAQSDYSGPTRIEAGTLEVTANGAPSPRSAIYLSSTATLKLSYSGTRDIPAFYIDGTRQPDGIVYSAATHPTLISGPGSIYSSPVTIERSGPNVVVSWSNSGTLQQSSDLTTWTDLPDAVSPLSEPASAQRKFFRLRQ
jgi:riboflavin kinase/FMN adenylyltransferase